MKNKKNISILGSTGSIGSNTLEVIRTHQELFKIIALSTNTSIELLYKQIDEFCPKYVVIGNESAYEKFKKNFSSYPNNNIKILFGDEGLLEIATLDEVDYVVNALVGFKGFIPTIEALKQNKVCAIANKETIVVGGEIINKIVPDKTRQIIPIDSEHSAIHQLLKDRKNTEISKLILTSSGGPFRKLPIEELNNVTLEQALNHPSWSMGNKITIDSATMMNKGFEVIEAHHLFNFDFDKIEVIVHKESIIHSMIETIDGEIYAQLGIPDMKFPIQNALTYPNIVSNNYNRLNLAEVKTLSFEKPDYQKFPLLKTAYEVGKIGGTLPAVLNSANEVVVNKFLKKEISYNDIYRYIRKTVEAHKIINNPSIEDVINTDLWAREYILKLI